MPRPRFDRLPKERREQILDVAAKEFATHGFEGASLNRVLGAAGLSKGAAYYYFDDKADLFAAVIQRFFIESVMNDLSAPPESADAFWDWVFSVRRRSMNQIAESPWLVGLAKATWKLPRKTWFDGRLSEVFGWAIQWMKDILRAAQRAGAIRSDLPEDLLIELLMAVDEVCDRWVADHWRAGENDNEVMEVSQRILDSVRRMLAPPVEGDRSPEAQAASTMVDGAPPVGTIPCDAAARAPAILPNPATKSPARKHQNSRPRKDKLQ